VDLTILSLYLATHAALFTSIVLDRRSFSLLLNRHFRDISNSQPEHLLTYNFGQFQVTDNKMPAAIRSKSNNGLGGGTRTSGRRSRIQNQRRAAAAMQKAFKARQSGNVTTIENSYTIETKSQDEYKETTTDRPAAEIAMFTAVIENVSVWVYVYI
jgi:hypothetical protein